MSKKNKIEKIILEIKKKEKSKFLAILNYFENISYKYLEDKIKLEIYYEKNSLEFYLTKKLLKNYDYQIKKVQNKNWVKLTNKEYVGCETNNFFFYQNFKRKVINKTNIVIPPGIAFGTGKHQSTELVVRQLEEISKRMNFYSPLDIGTGTGILTFVIRKFTKRKIYSTDLSVDSMNCFIYNKKINNFNDLFFIKCNGVNSDLLREKKFDLIVANLLLNEHKRILKNVCFHLKKKGLFIISGILKSEKNSLISMLRCFGLKFKKYTYLDGWVALVFERN